jgi:hypothetical protein
MIGVRGRPRKVRTKSFVAWRRLDCAANESFWLVFVVAFLFLFLRQKKESVGNILFAGQLTKKGCLEKTAF